ncbi:MAG: ferritin [Ignavibacteriae bacterium]|jgi:ferritin|nr:ferritin [Ignavibacteriota bacterium]NOG96736.1 ferritin [Ignavibacteriota bacterium]
MVSKKMESALNKQLNEELYSSYLYLSMSAYFEDQNLSGMAQWMKLQSDEEHIHAMKFYEFLIRIGARVQLDKINKPQENWKSPMDAFENAYEHEKFITKCINKLTDLAVAEKDHASSTFLHWFVDEQIEEESVANDIVQSFKMIGESKSALFMLDRELGRRGAAQQ